MIAWNREWVAKRQRGIARRERANARLEAQLLDPTIAPKGLDLEPAIAGR